MEPNVKHEKYLKRWAKTQARPKEAFEAQLAAMPRTFASLQAMKLPRIQPVIRGQY